MGGGPAIATGGAGYQHLITDTRPWYKNSRLISLNLCICLLLITSSTNGYDGSMMNGFLSVENWENEFQHPGGSKLGLFNAIQNIGSLAAYPISPYVADGFGRRSSIFFGAIIMVCATALQTASNSFGMFIDARFLIGFGLTFAASAAPLLVTEIAYPTQRAQATSMYNTLWYLGSIIPLVPSESKILLIWFVPESPRFLVSKGKEAKALQTLAYYHGNGNENDPLVQYEFQEIRGAIALNREVASNVGWTSLFKTPGDRRRMRIIIAIAFFSQWSGNGLVSYYLSKVLNSIGITDGSTQLLINGILNIFNFIVAIVAGFLCERVGRRRLFVVSMVGMAIFWTLQTVCLSLYTQDNTRTAAAHAFIAMICACCNFSRFSSMVPTMRVAFTPLVVSYTVEILPYALRAKGFTVFNFSVSLSLIFNQYVNPIALAKLGWKYYLVYVAWIAFEAVFCYFFVVETKNRSLEETAALFDGDDTVAMISEKAAAQAGVIYSAEGRSNDGNKKTGGK